ncbi:MAG: hypothetical protein J0L51_00090 [Rhizobiales bacterium]|nr:hypothetical protein [Hyphomicrobiales bacterium]
MTVPNANAAALMDWTGAETAFPAGFAAATVDEVVVRYRPLASRSLQPLARDTHYRVTLALDGAVTVTPKAMPAAPGKVEITRRSAIAQNIDFTNVGSFDADVHERLHDSAARRAAEARMLAERALRLPVGQTLDVMDPTGQAGKVLRLSADGKVLEFELPADVGLEVLADVEAAATAVAADRAAVAVDRAAVQALFEIVLDDGDQGDPLGDSIDDGDQ